LENALARKNTSANGHDRLEEAMAMLIQNQVAFLSRLAETDRATSERFARIEADMAAILRVLSEHSRLLERLPEAVRDRLGSKDRSSRGPPQDANQSPST
jgi:hypothetical protein